MKPDQYHPKTNTRLWLAGNAEHDDLAMSVLPHTAGFIWKNIPHDVSLFPIQKIQILCDRLLPVYHKTKYSNGYVCAGIRTVVDDDAHTIRSKSVELAALIDRPNLMISVPASENGIAAGQELLFAGTSVHFKFYSLLQYETVLKTYLRSIEDRDIHYRSLLNVTSVASFDVQAIDYHVNKLLESKSLEALNLSGRAATALAQFVVQKQLRYFSGESWRWLAEHGAHEQKVMWDTSRSTRDDDAASFDILHTIRAVSPEQFKRIKFDAGVESGAIPTESNSAADVVHDLGELGIHLDEVGEALLLYELSHENTSLPVQQ